MVVVVVVVGVGGLASQLDSVKERNQVDSEGNHRRWKKRVLGEGMHTLIILYFLFFSLLYVVVGGVEPWLSQLWLWESEATTKNAPPPYYDATPTAVNHDYNQ